jgi:NADH:ubiquinone oxidoreductase subunit D
LTEKPSIKKLKVVIQQVRAKKPYYLVRCYDSGRLIFQGKRLVKSDYALKWILYNQALVEQELAKVESRRGNSIRVVFSEHAERHFKLYLFYINSVLNIRSARRADCLARCWSRIDAISPIIDILLELMKITDPKRFSSLLRGYCLCR